MKESALRLCNARSVHAYFPDVKQLAEDRFVGLLCAVSPDANEHVVGVPSPAADWPATRDANA